MSKVLTPRQQEIVELAGQGRTVEQIAKSLDIGPTAVYGHATRIRKKGTKIELTTTASAANGNGSARSNGDASKREEVQQAITAIDESLKVNATERAEVEAEVGDLETKLDLARSKLSSVESGREALEHAREALV